MQNDKDKNCAEKFFDAELAERTAEGEQLAFVMLIDRYAVLLRAKAADFKDAGILEPEDLFQEGLVGLYQAACSYNAALKVSFKTYASVCVNNRMMTAVKNAKRKKYLPFVNYISLNSPEENKWVDLFYIESTANPEELFILRENFENLDSYIQKILSKFEYKVLTLYLSGCSYENIALELHITSKAVDNALQRVRHKLRRAMSE